MRGKMLLFYADNFDNKQHTFDTIFTWESQDLDIN
jgi:hypothetical protein